MSGNSAAEPLVNDWEPSDERRHLAESLRRLLDVVVETGAGPAELGAAETTDRVMSRSSRRRWTARAEWASSSSPPLFHCGQGLVDDVGLLINHAMRGSAQLVRMQAGCNP